MSEPNHAKNYEQIANYERPSFWPWVLLYGVVVSCGLLFTAWCYFITGADRAKFLAESVASAAVLAVIIVQAIIYHQQRDLLAQQIEAAAIAERAYLGFTKVGTVNPITNNQIEIRMLLVNGGRTPARDIDRRVRAGLVESPPDPFSWSDPITTPSVSGISFMAAGAERTLTAPHILNVTTAAFKDFEAEKTNIYIDGEIRFTDYTGKRQVFGFGYVSRFRDNGGFQERYQYQRDANPN